VNKLPLERKRNAEETKTKDIQKRGREGWMLIWGLWEESEQTRHYQLTTHPGQNATG
jgi:hypothetical protein